MYDVFFDVPAEEGHRYAQFEALTGYMPPEFNRFWTLDPKSGKLADAGPGPGEQAHPIIVATEDGKFAMGVFSPDQPSPGFEEAGYGRFFFENEKVAKWICVFRKRDAAGIPGDKYPFRMFVAVGTLQDVQRGLKKLIDQSAEK